MYNKKIRNKLKLFAGMLLCAIAVLSAPATTLVTYAANSTEVAPCTDILEWLYKIEDGKMYKALYNASTGQYVTDWQYVCDWPPEE